MKKLLVITGLLMCSTSVFAMSPVMYSRVMASVRSRDLTALKNLVANGVELNSPNQNGVTPLCETVARGDYVGYEMLQTQGASPYVSCMRRLPQDYVARFYANQPAPNTFYTGRMGAAKSARDWSLIKAEDITIPYLGIGEILLAGAAAGAIVGLGHGKSSSGGGGGDSKWAAPLDLDPDAWKNTAQYQADLAPSGYKSVNFLGAINAADAYARGYTGYNINREPDGTLIGTGEAAILKNKPVVVGVVDNGVWAKHNKLEANTPLISNKTYNFVYGPCDEGTTTSTTSSRCWTWKADDPAKESDPHANDVGKFYLYVDGQEDKQWKTEDETHVATNALPGSVLRGEWLVYKTRYDGVSNNALANNPNPTEQYVWLENSNTVYEYYVDSLGGKFMYDPETGYSAPVTCSEGICSYTKDDVVHKVSQEIDYTNHGTMVAGLIAAANTNSNFGMMGVAYNANIIPIKGDEITENVINHIKEAVDYGADIVNVSYGSTAKLRNSGTSLVQTFDYNMLLRPDYYNAYLSAAQGIKDGKEVQKGTILVFSAGNYTHTEEPSNPYDSSVYSMAPLSSSFNGTTPVDGTSAGDGVVYNLTNLFVNVVAVDSNNKLASYSAKCGITKDYCIAAPGGDSVLSGASASEYVYSTAKGIDGSLEDTYEGNVGTSFAAPIVSGALAVIKGAFPHLTNQQVVQILFETAKNIGDADLYGHGLVDLEAATSPVGLQKISLSSSTKGTAAVASNSMSSISPVFSGVANALPAQMIVLDKYERAFTVPTSSFVHVSKRENKLEGRFKSFMSGDEKVVAQTDTLKMAYSERHSRLSSQMPQGSVRFELNPTDRWQFKTFYSENTVTSGGTYFERLLFSPYGKMKEAWGGSVGYKLAKNWKTTVLGQVGQNGFVDDKDLSHMEHNRMSLFQGTVQYTGFKKIGLKAVAGVANEQGSLFGMWGRGAFKTGNSKTSYVGAGVTLNLTDAITLEGMYYSGSTKISDSNSLVQMSNVKSDSFAMTASWQMDEDRTLGLHFMSPLRVKRGTARVTLPVGRDAYEDIVYQQTTQANLKPSAREYDLGIYFTDALRENVQMKSEFGVRLNPDHAADAAPDWRALVGMHWGL